MEMIIHDENKYVSIWLTKSEASDSKLQDELKPIYAEYKMKKYRVAVFKSGDGDLTTLTKDILKHAIDVDAKSM